MSFEVDPNEVSVVHRACGAFLGSAVGDALGAPFEFGVAGDYRRAYPDRVGGIGEMAGGGGFGWEPGQFTDDTEMAVATAASLLACGGFDADDQLQRYRAWMTGASDVGLLTTEVLGSGLPATEAAEAVYQRRGGRGAAGNGSLMRAAPGAIHFAPAGRDATMKMGRQLSAVTHADPLAQWAVAIQHELVRVAMAGGDPLAAVPEVLTLLPPDVGSVYDPLLHEDWDPSRSGPGNGSAMGALAQAVWAVRRHDTFEEAVVAVVDLGDDTDSAGAITGMLAGAIHGLGAIPSRWITYVHGYVTPPSGERQTYNHLDLQNLARRLLGTGTVPDPPDEPALGPVEISPGVHAASRAGARNVPRNWATVSLCRIDDDLRRPVRREVYLVDRDAPENPTLPWVLEDVLASIAAFRAEGREVVVHCHGGRSRTAFVLTAWLMASEGLSRAEATSRLLERWPEAVDWTPSFGALLAERDGSG